jgi:tetratricopeptide (TPR) repeat protein
VHNAKGDAYYRLGDFDVVNFEEAIKCYDRAIVLDEKYPLAIYNRGYSYGCLGNYEVAITNFDRVIALCPYSGEAYDARGLAYRYLAGTIKGEQQRAALQRAVGDHREAIGTFSLDKIRPEFPYHLALALARLVPLLENPFMEIQEANHIFACLTACALPARMKVAPFEIWSEWGNLFYDNAERRLSDVRVAYLTAADKYEKAIDLAPRDAQLRLCLANCYCSLADRIGGFERYAYYHRAAESYENAIALAGDNPTLETTRATATHSHLAYVSSRISCDPSLDLTDRGKQTRHALTLANQARDQNPEDPVCLENAALVLWITSDHVENGPDNLREAASIWRTLSSTEGTDSRYRLNYALTLLDLAGNSPPSICLGLVGEAQFELDKIPKAGIMESRLHRTCGLANMLRAESMWTVRHRFPRVLRELVVRIPLLQKTFRSCRMFSSAALDFDRAASLENERFRGHLLRSQASVCRFLANGKRAHLYEAREACEQAGGSRNPDNLHLLAVIASLSGKKLEAVSFLARALKERWILRESVEYNPFLSDLLKRPELQ